MTTAALRHPDHRRKDQSRLQEHQSPFRQRGHRRHPGACRQAGRRRREISQRQHRARALTDPAMATVTARSSSWCLSSVLRLSERRCRRSVWKPTTAVKCRQRGADRQFDHRAPWDPMNLYRSMVRSRSSPWRPNASRTDRRRGNKTAQEIYDTARRCALRLHRDYGMPFDDIFLDMSVSAIIADTTGSQPRDARRHQADRHRRGSGGRTDGRALQHRPAIAAEGRRRIGTEASRWKVRLSTSPTRRVRYGARHAVVRLSPVARGQLRALAYPQLSSRPAATRCAPCASSTKT